MQLVLFVLFCVVLRHYLASLRNLQKEGTKNYTNPNFVFNRFDVGFSTFRHSCLSNYIDREGEADGH